MRNTCGRVYDHEVVIKVIKVCVKVVTKVIWSYESCDAARFIYFTFSYTTVLYPLTSTSCDFQNLLRNCLL